MDSVTVYQIILVSFQSGLYQLYRLYQLCRFVTSACLFAQCSAEPEHLLAVREPEDSQQ